MHSTNHSPLRFTALRRVSLPLALTMIAACTDGARDPATPTGPTAAPSFARGGNGDNNGRIVFQSARHLPFVNDEFDIYSMNPDGTGVTRLTYSPGFDGEASSSPDGKRIVFRSDRDDPLGEIYVMNADGTGVTRLTYSPGFERTPAWSKDGKRIAFASARHVQNPSLQDLDIFVMNADGTGVTRLAAAPGRDELPSWSADGKQIAFSSERDHVDAFDVYTMNADGSQVTRVTYFVFGAPMPVSWSPGGKQLAFSGNHVYVVNVDGTQLTRLTWTMPNADVDPSWSVDAKQIAFVSSRNGGWEIFTMNADGTGVTRLTNNSDDEFRPSWGR